MSSNDLPQTNSVHVSVGAVAVGLEEGVFVADEFSSVKVVPVVGSHVFVEVSASDISSFSNNNLSVEFGFSPAPGPDGFRVNCEFGDVIVSIS